MLIRFFSFVAIVAVPIQASSPGAQKPDPLVTAINMFVAKINASKAPKIAVAIRPYMETIQGINSTLPAAVVAVTGSGMLASRSFNSAMDNLRKAANKHHLLTAEDLNLLTLPLSTQRNSHQNEKRTKKPSGPTSATISVEPNSCVQRVFSKALTAVNGLPTPASVPDVETPGGAEGNTCQNEVTLAKRLIDDASRKVNEIVETSSACVSAAETYNVLQTSVKNLEKKGKPARKLKIANGMIAEWIEKLGNTCTGVIQDSDLDKLQSSGEMFAAGSLKQQAPLKKTKN